MAGIFIYLLLASEPLSRAFPRAPGWCQPSFQITSDSLLADGLGCRSTETTWAP